MDICVTGLQSLSGKISQSTSRLRSVGTFELCFGYETQSNPPGFTSLIAIGTSLSTSALFRINRCTTSKLTAEVGVVMSSTSAGSVPNCSRYPSGALSISTRCFGLMPSFLSKGVSAIYSLLIFDHRRILISMISSVGHRLRTLGGSGYAVYLKRLEMLGFKSFAVRTCLEFSSGITAVVGPNGAGKSNVADAVRWVLGEQSMRQLRGKKSEDIIFSGGHGRAALGMAEVSLTLDNSTGWVPSEYSEITVTRRSYRSGENEYLINKQKVRLKDVVLLLAQARIGHDSYTVVGQGAIDAALSLRAEERRGLFEDAAGIRPFQVQRADAESRLKQTEQNLERLRDIVSEIEPRLAPLAEQARRAVEFGQLNTELQEVLFSWYALQWRRLRAQQEHAELAEQEQAQKVLQVESALKALEEQGNSLRTTRQQTQTRISEARKAYGEANDFVQKIERDLAVSEERVVGLERQRNDFQQEERRL